MTKTGPKTRRQRQTARRRRPSKTASQKSEFGRADKILTRFFFFSDILVRFTFCAENEDLFLIVWICNEFLGSG